ncbi:Galactose/lactose metabolism regulatory protein GAL80 [Trichoderma lentiforme]|uniref:Galactose/lactose metabolism regulatory protein GAL80 n=1 Tax=Trichoderma lentiforme TaxID=1567552 RepID=A0A9P5C6M7_9HYPO|nr:Galactose/lactose metabolism regulatory protein GAL80 [Trichoderma lentiforme]
MSQIKVGFIGLSSRAKVKWGANAHLPYFQSSRGKEKFQIIAVQNSSIESAQQAIKDFGLPATTRAYDNPEDMAADPDVQLVINVTGVFTHYPSVLPSVKAGKDVFVEWPLADSTEHIRELAIIASDNNIRTGVGLQGRFAPVFLKVKEVLVSGRYGRVLSSEVKSAFPHNPRDILPVGWDAFATKKFGINTYTIGFGHLIDVMQSILGEVHDIHTHFQIQRPELKRVDLSTGEVVGTAQTDVPDLVILVGSLKESAIVRDSATLLVRYRKGVPFKDETAFIWTINCEEGELRVISPGGPAFQLNVYSEPVTIEVHDCATDEVNPIEWKWSDYQLAIPEDARATAALYEAYAAGVENEAATFQTALHLQEQLEEWLTSFER